MMTTTQLEMLRETGLTDREAFMLMDSLSSLNRTKVDLCYAAEHLADDMVRLAKTVREGRMVNGLGEVQGRGPTVDRLCALVEERTQAFSTLCRALGVPEATHDLLVKL